MSGLNIVVIIGLGILSAIDIKNKLGICIPKSGYKFSEENIFKIKCHKGG